MLLSNWSDIGSEHVLLSSVLLTSDHFAKGYVSLDVCVRSVGTILICLEIIAVAKHYQLHLPHFGFIISSLAIDLIQYGIAIVHVIIYLSWDNTKHIAPWICIILKTIDFSSKWVSSLFPAVLALEQYVFVCKPFKYQQYITIKTVLITNLVVWVAIPALVFLGNYDTVSSKIVCAMTKTQSTIAMISISITLLFSMIILVFSVYKINKAINTQVHVLGQLHAQIATHQDMKKIRMLVLVCGTFFITYLPIIILFAIQKGTYDAGQGGSLSLILAAKCIQTTDNISGPVVVYATHSTLRIGIRKLMGQNVHFEAPVEREVRHENVQDSSV